MNEYALEEADGHLLFEHDGRRVLVDTGAPASVGNAPEWEFLGQPRALAGDYLGVTVEQIAELAGLDIDVLLGADVLTRLHTEIDMANDRIVFHETRPDMEGVTMGLANVMGIPVTAAKVDRWLLHAVVDTGAKLSYVDRALAESYPKVGEADDFYPVIGRFTTTVHEVPFSIADAPMTLRCGVLPDQLGVLFASFGVSSIIGTELYEQFHTCLALPDAEMVLVSV